MGTFVRTQWTGNMSFDALVTGHHLPMDVGIDAGGEDKGPRPKALLLAALSGCTGMDVVSILKKMQLSDYKLEIVSEAESTTEHPVIYHTILVKSMFEGEELPAEKIKKAVSLSADKYCGVNAMLSKAAKVITKTYINDVEV